jgi:hypothetical protein
MSVPVIIQHSEPMRPSILLIVASLAVPYFWKNVIVHKMFSLILSETFLRSIKGDTTIKVYGFSCKVPLFLSAVNET